MQIEDYEDAMAVMALRLAVEAARELDENLRYWSDDESAEEARPGVH